VIGRIVIDNVRPRTPTGSYPAKVIVGAPVAVSADIFRDGHDMVAAQVRWRPLGEATWRTAAMALANPGLDLWQATFETTVLGAHEVVVDAWTDAYATWRHKAEAKLGAGQDIATELEEGARLLESVAPKRKGPARTTLVEAAAALRSGRLPAAERLAPALTPDVAALVTGPPKRAEVTSSGPRRLWADRERALVGAWYELFPRSEGGLDGTADRLPAIAAMGFDVVYLPPIHPIGRQFRKGPNNTLTAGPDDVGSPWAIGGREGGHTSIHPDLGTFTDFGNLVARAGELGMEIALDYALQCSADHPWVTEHPDWFHCRPDGTIAYAENPPKKYQDIYPINFWPPTEALRQALWSACKEILDFWIARGVRIFRVDNPHTKPMAFWEWLMPAVQAEHPDVVFLAEAFTRPKVMAKLAEVGFSQSYTYFTWRTTATELREYVEEVALSDKAEYMRPSFWPNTPDILAPPLRNAPASVFKLRLLLAATLVPSYGIYSGYELIENEPMSDANEEYFHSEKYEVRRRNWDDPRSIAPFVTKVNRIRRHHPALSRLGNITFHDSANEHILAYSKVSDDGTDVVLVVVNLNGHDAQETTLGLDLAALGMPVDRQFEAYDEMTSQSFTWQGGHPYVRLDPTAEVAHVLHLRAL